MKILAIDPGPTKSAWLIFDNENARLIDFGKAKNEFLKAHLEMPLFKRTDYLAIEIVKSYGNIIGDSVLLTAEWIGIFSALYENPISRLTRKEIVTHLCGHARANDRNVRQSILDRFGGKDLALGKKSSPGPLYGVKRDIWSALAVALTFSDLYAHFLE